MATGSGPSAAAPGWRSWSPSSSSSASRERSACRSPCSSSSSSRSPRRPCPPSADPDPTARSIRDRRDLRPRRHHPRRPVRRREAPDRGRRRGPSGRDPRAVAPDPRQPGARLRGAPGGGLGRRGGPPATASSWSTRSAAWRRRSGASSAAAGEGIARGSAILAEYDALPGLGHGCGHNTMAASGVGAAIALAAIAPELPGEIVFLGTPAEERGSGKGIMIDDGLFEGLDAALLYHPSDAPRRVPAARQRGHRRHRSTAARRTRPRSRGWAGTRSTRSSCCSTRSACGASSSARTPASTGSSRRAARRPTSSPSRTKAWFMVRSPREDEYALMRERFREMCEARRGGDRLHGRGRLRGRGLDDEAQPDPRRPVRGEHGRLRRRRRAADRQPRQHRHGQRQPGHPDDPPVDRDLRRGRARATRSSSATPPRRRAPTR